MNLNMSDNHFLNSSALSGRVSSTSASTSLLLPENLQFSFVLTLRSEDVLLNAFGIPRPLSVSKIEARILKASSPPSRAIEDVRPPTVPPATPIMTTLTNNDEVQPSANQIIQPEIKQPKPKSKKSGKSHQKKRSADHWEVEKIIDKRYRASGVEYLLRWKNYSEEHDTWEKLEHMSCGNLIQEFERNLKARKLEFISGISGSANAGTKMSSQNSSRANKANVAGETQSSAVGEVIQSSSSNEQQNQTADRVGGQAEIPEVSYPERKLTTTSDPPKTGTENSSELRQGQVEDFPRMEISSNILEFDINLIPVRIVKSKVDRDGSKDFLVEWKNYRMQFAWVADSFLKTCFPHLVFEFYENCLRNIK